MSKAIMTAKEIITGQTAIETKIKAVHKAGQSLQKAVHVAAVSVLAHIEKHNDIRLVGTLMLALPAALRTNAIRDWFTHYGPVTFGAKDELMFVKGKKIDLAAAMLDPFWKFSPEKPYTALKLEDWIKQSINKLERDAKETNRDHSILITSLKNMATNPAVVHAQ